MQAEDRPIHFSTELIHEAHRYEMQGLQKLYYALSQTDAAYEGSELGAPGPPQFHIRRGRTQSVALFMPDRVVLFEEWVDTPMSAFLERVRAVCARLPETVGVSAFTAQAATIRTTLGLTCVEDARAFVMERICGQAGRFTPHIDRPVAMTSLRLVLPPTPEHRGFYTVAIEPFRESPREVFVEVKGVYAGVSIPAASPEPACAHIKEVRRFISDSLFPYLNQFDSRVEGAT